MSSVLKPMGVKSKLMLTDREKPLLEKVAASLFCLALCASCATSVTDVHWSGPKVRFRT